MVPTHYVQETMLDLPTAQAFRLNSATSLPRILESTEKTSPHRKHISDLLRPGQQGCPRLFLPGNGQHQRCQKGDGTDPQRRAWLRFQQVLSTGFWLFLHLDSGVGWRGICPISSFWRVLYGLRNFLGHAIFFLQWGHNNNGIYVYMCFAHTYVTPAFST